MDVARHLCGRLGTDVIDLYQVHFGDSRLPTDEALQALDDLIHEG